MAVKSPLCDYSGVTKELQSGDTLSGGGDPSTATHAATSKTPPVDADEIPLADSAASFALKKLTWANLKATIKAYTDTLYPSGSGTSTGTNTGDQTSVSGNAGTATALQTARTIDGQSFNGTANITVIAPGTHAASSKTTPADADEIPLVDSAASNTLAKLTIANLKTAVSPTTAAAADPFDRSNLIANTRWTGGEIGYKIAEMMVRVVPSTNKVVDVEPYQQFLADGASITSLTNYGSSGTDGTQSTSANRATLRARRLAGMDIAEFDGTNDSYTFGTSLSTLTQGSIYLLARKTNDPSTAAHAGHWQTETGSSVASLLGWDQGSYETIQEMMFSSTYHDTDGITEPMTDWFLYEVHASGSNYEMILNSWPVYTSTSNTFAAPNPFYLGTSYGNYLEGSVARLLVYSQAHNAEQRRLTRYAIANHHGVDILDHAKKCYIFEGTSITWSYPYDETSGHFDYAYPSQFALLSDANIKDYYGKWICIRGSLAGSTVHQVYDRRRTGHVHDIGYLGSYLEDMISQFPTEVVPRIASFGPTIVILEGGTNDINRGDSLSTIQGKILSYKALCDAAGVALWVTHVYPRAFASQSAMDAIKNSLNTWITSTFPGRYIPVHSSMTNYTDTTVYNADQVHPNQLGYQYMAQQARAYITL